MIRMSNHTHMPWQRQHILLRYFKTLSDLLWGSNPQLPLQQPDALQHVLTVKMLKKSFNQDLLQGTLLHNNP